MNNTNPFLQEFKLKDQAVPFDKIKTEHYLPALDIAIAGAKANLDAIKDNKQTPNFENTILALETSGELVDTISSVFNNLFSAEANEAHQALAPEFSSKIASYMSDIALDEKLFSKVKSVYDQMNQLSLNDEQKRLVEKFYKDFVRNGALLNSTEKETLRNIDQELSKIGPKFSENVLKATNAFELYINDKNQLKGVPDSILESLAADAKEKGKEGQYLITLHAPSVMPILQYADDANLREKLWKAYSSKSFGDAYDNQEIVKKIVKLRHQRANLLGYKTHAEFVLAERMAENPKKVFDFLNKLLTPSKEAAKKDLAELAQFKKSLNGSDKIEPWDVAYYSEKLKEQKYSFNEEEVRPYFKLENVLNGVFKFAENMFNLSFKEVTDVPGYHPDVKVFEVTDTATNDYVALFYADFYPRPTKKGGAWMTTYREQGLMRNQVRRPHVSIVCNLTKPTPTKPSLLNLDEVLTVFHEFGHALHGLLSKCNYRTLAGTNVLWDFVELPSQIMENWVYEKEALDLFARHFETNEPIPTELIKKIKASANFQAGYYSLRQINFGILDMAWHSQDPNTIMDVDQFEEKATSETRLLPKVSGTNTSCSFSHIFPGGYSAGYYSYKWAEVLDADAFELFKEKGVLNKEIAQKFKDTVLSKGNTEHPMNLYKKFRGREPDPSALLRRSGLL